MIFAVGQAGRQRKVAKFEEVSIHLCILLTHKVKNLEWNETLVESRTTYHISFHFSISPIPQHRHQK